MLTSSYEGAELPRTRLLTASLLTVSARKKGAPGEFFPIQECSPYDRYPTVVNTQNHNRQIFRGYINW